MYWSAFPAKIDVLAANTMSRVKERDTAEALQPKVSPNGFRRTLHE